MKACKLLAYQVVYTAKYIAVAQTYTSSYTAYIAPSECPTVYSTYSAYIAPSECHTL